MAAINVYLVAKEALQAARILEPDYFPLDWADYYFTSEDRSVFVVLSWFSGNWNPGVVGVGK